jgi:hypothetical protein
MTRADREAIAAANPKVDLAKVEEALALRGRLKEALAPCRAARRALELCRRAKAALAPRRAAGKPGSTFVEARLAGEARPDDIDDLVARWHRGEGGPSLAAFLGMTDEEYAAWVPRPDSLGAIVLAHREGIGLEEAARREEAAPQGRPVP